MVKDKFISGGIAYTITVDGAPVSGKKLPVVMLIHGNFGLGALLKRLTISPNIPAHQNAELYCYTRVALNVFRTIHHFNRPALPATSLNPRIYKALACGALELSEAGPEMGKVFPSLPTFDNRCSVVVARTPPLRRASSNQVAGGEPQKAGGTFVLRSPGSSTPTLSENRSTRHTCAENN